MATADRPISDLGVPGMTHISETVMGWGAASGTPLATRGRTVRFRRQAADGQPTIRFMVTFIRTRTLDTARRTRDQTLTARSMAATVIDSSRTVRQLGVDPHDQTRVAAIPQPAYNQGEPAAITVATL